MSRGIPFRMTAGEQTVQRNKPQSFNTLGWLGRQDSNLGMAESKSAALPLGYAPPRHSAADDTGAGAHDQPAEPTAPAAPAGATAR